MIPIEKIKQIHDLGICAVPARQSKHVCAYRVVDGLQDLTYPIPRDGYKGDNIDWEWGLFKSRFPNDAELYFFSNQYGKHNNLAIITGAVSGNLEVIDVDDSSIFDEFYAMILEYFKYTTRMVFPVKTKNGYHIYFYNDFDMSDAPEDVSNCGSQKLANFAKGEDGTTPVRIETRGEGGYVIGPPSENYTFMGNSDLSTIPTWTISDRETVFAMARTFNLNFKKEYTKAASTVVDGDYKHTPWGQYNNDENNPWLDMLLERGWRLVSEDSERIYMLRPGDTSAEQSGNFHKSKRLFWCWSTSTEIEDCRAYTPSYLRTLLIYGEVNKENLSKNLLDLLEAGYGQKWTNKENRLINKATKVVSNYPALEPEDLLRMIKIDLGADFSIIEDTPIVDIAKKKIDLKEVQRVKKISGKNAIIKEHLDAKQIKRNDITFKLEKKSGEEIDDYEYNSLHIDIMETKNVSRVDMDRVCYSNYIHTYNPFTTYFNKLDGIATTDSINKVFDSLCLELNPVFPVSYRGEEKNVNEDAICRSLFTKWMLQIIASSYKVGPLDIMLIFSGPKNNGKTHFFKHLLPEQLRQKYFTSIQDFPKKEEDAKSIMAQSLLLLRDDIKGLGSKDSAWQKQILSSEVLTFRPAYGRTIQDFQRYAVLCGTTNDDKVIPDDGGNRRIFPLKINKINHELYNSVVEDSEELLWKELKGIWETASTKREQRDLFRVSADEMAYLSSLQSFTEEDSIKDAVQMLIGRSYEIEGSKGWFKTGVDTNTQATSPALMRPAEIMTHITDNCKWIRNLNSTKLGKILVELGFERLRTKECRFYMAYPIQVNHDAYGGMKPNNGMPASDEEPQGAAQGGVDDLPF